VPLAKNVQLAAARRRLKRIEEDRPAFRLRLESEKASPEATKKMTEWFEGILDRAREEVRLLESEVERSGTQL
jgi:hypothetical protein